MANVLNIPPPDPMDVKGDVAENWAYFRQTFENFIVAIDCKKEEQATAILKSIMGKDCAKILKRLNLTDEELKVSKSILDALEKHFEPQRNTIYERYIFNCAVQLDSETVDDFILRLRNLASTCQYGALHDELLRDRIVVGVNDNGARSRLLREKKLTLDQAVTMCKTSEQTRNQLRTMNPTEENAQSNTHAVKEKAAVGRTPPSSKFDDVIRSCKFCAGEHPRGQCPAFGKRCNQCGNKNHFSRCCPQASSVTPKSNSSSRLKNKSAHMLQEDFQTQGLFDDDSVYSVSYPYKSSKKQYFCNAQVLVNGKSKVHRFQLDSGSNVNAIPLSEYRNLMDCTNPVLKPSSTNLTVYNQTKLRSLGHATLTLTVGQRTSTLQFHVVPYAPCALLSGSACEDLGLMTFDTDFVINSVASGSKLSSVLDKYSDVFCGLGHIGTYHIDVDTSVTPVRNINRRVPFALRDELKSTLDKMETNKILAKVTEPTPWISNMVAVRKPGKLRVCIDPLNLNRAIIRNHYPMPILDDITPKLHDAKVFSVLDAKDGFLQVALDESSSFLTTFWTPFGKYRWLRMPFGISSAPEEFQRRLDDILQGLDNVERIADDVIIYGTGPTDELAEKSHDLAFENLLKRARSCNLKFNRSKLKYKLSEVAYVGHIFSSEGLKVDPMKVKAISEMVPPKDIKGVQRLLGTVQYLSKFLPNLSDVSEPLRRLCDKDAAFDWQPVHEHAFNTLKDLVCKAPVLKYFNPKEPVYIECDASGTGLGCALLQDGHPIAYASRALSTTEMKYAPIELEALAVVFACERFESYIYGRVDTVNVFSDHKPLEQIFSKSILTAPKRLQRMRLRCQKFNIAVKYKCGLSQHLADTLSRAPLPSNQVTPELCDAVVFRLLDEQEFYQDVENTDVMEHLELPDKQLERVRIATRRDVNLQTLMNVILEGWPSNKQETPLCTREYWAYRDELSAHNGLIFRGTRVIMPESLRSDMLRLAHRPHLGIENTLNVFRDIMYWPGLQKDVTQLLSSCPVCNELKPSQTKEPMMSYPVPTRPWEILSSDCFDLRGKHYVVIVDHYSDFIDLHHLPDFTAKSLVQIFKRAFATHGVPRLLISDNGGNYIGSVFKNFTNEWQFDHIFSSPRYPKANGKAESAVKIMKSLMEKCLLEGTDFHLALLAMRNTPNSPHKSSPVQRLMSRRTRSQLPVLKKLYEPQVIPPSAVQAEITERKQIAKKYYDAHAKTLPPLQVGQPVRMQTPAGWKPAVVSQKHASRSYDIQCGDMGFRRNRTHIREDSSHSPVNVDLPLVASPGVHSDNIDTPLLDVSPPSGVPSVATPPPQAPRVPQSPTPKSSAPCSPVTPSPHVKTRSGRVSRPPSFLKDYDFSAN